MALRKELELNWGGKDYKLMVTMAVIDRIEDHLSVAKMAQQLSTGDIRLSHVAKLISLILNEAGADVDQEAVYVGLTENGEVSQSDMINLVSNIMASFFPEQKKSTATSKKKTKAK